MSYQHLARALTAFVLVSAATPSLARAEANAHFGRTGQLFLQGSTGLGIGYTRTDVGADGVNRFNLAFSPRAGVFFADNAFVALDLTGGFAGNLDNWSGNVGVGPSLGVRVAMGPRANFAPSLAALYLFRQTHAKADLGLGTVDAGHTRHAAALRLALPVVVELRNGLGLSVGPTLQQVVVARQDGAADRTHRELSATVDVGLVGWL